MASLTRRLASRVRSGLSRRVSPLLERVGLRAPRAAAAPVVQPAGAAPVVAPAPVVVPEPEVGPQLTRAEVEQVLEDLVRPALRSDGGDIELVDVRDNDVYVALQGACHSCPSSIVTMQDGIQRILREEFPHFGDLVRVDG